MVKAITEYAQVPWEHMGRALASALGIREVLPLKVSTERIGARVSQRCECVCVCVCVLQRGCAYEENEHQHDEAKKLPVSSPQGFKQQSDKVRSTL